MAGIQLGVKALHTFLEGSREIYSIKLTNTFCRKNDITGIRFVQDTKVNPHFAKNGMRLGYFIIKNGRDPASSKMNECWAPAVPLKSMELMEKNLPHF